MPAKLRPTVDVEQPPVATPMDAHAGDEQVVSKAEGSAPDAAQHATEDEEPACLTREPVAWVRGLSRNYSWRLLTVVICTNHLLKGFVAGGGDEGLVGKPMDFIFADLGMPATQLQMMKAAAISPWALKPVVALLSDAIPICGYRKMPYVVLATLAALVSTLLLGFSLTTSVPVVVASLFLIFLQVSSVDLLVEAKQSEEVKQKAKFGPQLITFTWLGINVAQVASVILLGPLIHHCGARLPYVIAAPFITLVLWPVLANYLGEQPVPPADRCPNFRTLRRHPTLCTMTLLVGSMVLMLIISSFVLTQRQLILMAVVMGALVLTSFWVFIRREIAGPVVFYFLLGALSFNVDGALFYFYTDTPASFPCGPHFTAYFYTTGLGAANFIGVMVGFITGAQLFKNWSYRLILVVMVPLRAFTQLLLVPALLRWSSQGACLDSFCVICAVALDSVVGAWRWIPKQVMGAHLAPQGVEATTLGLIRGSFNLAMILSSYFGGFVLDSFGIRPSGGAGDELLFENLWKVQVVAALTPCSMLLLLPALIPSKRQTEALLVERRDSATHGSIFEAVTSSRVAGKAAVVATENATMPGGSGSPDANHDARGRGGAS